MVKKLIVNYLGKSKGVTGEDLEVGDLVPVQIVNRQDYDLIAEYIGEGGEEDDLDEDRYER